eukprot:TRINITY_DN22482_c0_g1_i1.p1 TRINITY_DN22482_c0_g1~~TRINITY_DN22482_c0_g1_i1.p1  ORF type:complete len:232 (-),score=12.92 TRINITY_DN22482_c0_g1_i1:91-786(-)
MNPSSRTRKSCSMFTPINVRKKVDVLLMKLLKKKFAQEASDQFNEIFENYKMQPNKRTMSLKRFPYKFTTHEITNIHTPISQADMLNKRYSATNNRPKIMPRERNKSLAKLSIDTNAKPKHYSMPLSTKNNLAKQFYINKFVADVRESAKVLDGQLSWLLNLKPKSRIVLPKIALKTNAHEKLCRSFDVKRANGNNKPRFKADISNNGTQLLQKIKKSNWRAGLWISGIKL